MREYSERDIDNLSAILDYCDRISSINERFGNSFEHENNRTIIISPGRQRPGIFCVFDNSDS